MKFIFLIFSNILFASNDSTKVDSVYYTNLGSNYFLEETIPSKSDFDKSSSTYELLENLTPTIILNRASHGLENSLTFLERNPDIMIDGRSIGNPFSGNFNLFYFPKEWISSIEYRNDALSTFQFQNHSFGTINFVTKDFSTTPPLTKIFYEQGPYDFGTFDAHFTQNIFQNANLSAGLTRDFFGSNRESEGFKGRFPNENFDSWIFRTKLRAQLSKTISFQTTYFTSQGWKGLNGGINLNETPKENYFSDVFAIVNDRDSYEKNKQNHFDLILSFDNSIFENQKTKIHLYHSNFLNEFRDNENRPELSSLSITIDYRTKISGAILSHSFFSKYLNLTAQTEIINREVEPNYFVNFKSNIFQNSFFGVVNPSSFLKLDLFYQTYLIDDPTINWYLVSSKDDKRKQSYGLVLNFKPIANINLFAGYSNSYFDKLFDDRSRIFPIDFGDDIRKYDVGVKFLFGKSFIKFKYENYSLNNFTKSSVNSISTELFFKTDNFTFSGFVFAKDTNIFYSDIHKQYARLNIFYNSFKIQNTLDIDFGIETQFIQPISFVIKQNQLFIFDFVILGKIKEATLHFKLENLSDENIMFVEGYPLMPRGMKFGISWEFIN